MLEQYQKSLHRLGRVMLVISVCVLIAVPFVIGVLFDGTVQMSGFWRGFINVAVLYYPIAIVEFLIYTPMLGVGGSYISFITGNVTNMKIPCVMNAQDIAGTKQGSPEQEIISTISTATSAIVTTLVIVVGVILIVPLQPMLNHPTLKPAFDYILPALFGALGLKYFIKSPLIALVSVGLVSLLCILVPSMCSQASTLMIVCGILALGFGYFLFKKGKL